MYKSIQKRKNKFYLFEKSYIKPSLFIRDIIGTFP